MFIPFIVNAAGITRRRSSTVASWRSGASSSRKSSASSTSSVTEEIEQKIDEKVNELEKKGEVKITKATEEIEQKIDDRVQELEKKGEEKIAEAAEEVQAKIEKQIEEKVEAFIKKLQDQRNAWQTAKQSFRAPSRASLLSSIGWLIRILFWLSPWIVLSFFMLNIYLAVVNSLCEIPGATYISRHCQVPFEGTKDKFTSLERMHAHLIEVQQLNSQSIAAPMKLAYLKTVVRETEAIVKHSDLPSKPFILDGLQAYWNLAETTGDDLLRFLSGMDLMLDSVITSNDYTLLKLQKVQKLQASRSMQVVAVLFNRPLNYHEAVREEYVQHLETIKNRITVLLVTSVTVRDGLRQLSDIQFGIRDVVVGDEHVIEERKDQLKAQWFRQNTRSLNKFEKLLQILKVLDQQRQVNQQTIDDIIYGLSTMQSKADILLQELQEPGFDLSTDLALQIAIIRRTVEALTSEKSRVRAERKATMAEIRGQLRPQLGNSDLGIGS